MKTISRYLLCSALAVAVVSPAAVSAGAGGTARPYKASGVLTGSVDPFGVFVLDGPSIGAHYGRGPTHVAGSFGGATNFTVTAASGATITGTFVGPGGPVDVRCPEGWGVVSDLYRLTGGTGRFAGATGAISVAGCALVDPSTGAFAVTFTASGTISY